jgi:hypothetical protein
LNSEARWSYDGPVKLPFEEDVMKTIAVFLCCAVLILAFPVAGFSQKDPAPIPEMADFMKSFFGSSALVSKGLDKYGAPNLKRQDMDLYDLKTPKIIKTELKGTVANYTIEAKAGIMVYTFILSWDKGKIVEIQDKGAR